MTDTFRVDNGLLQNLQIYGSRTPKPDQPYLPGLEPLGPFDLWLTLGCYRLLDPKHPDAPVEATLTEVLETLEFSRVITEAETGYRFETFKTDDYTRIRESFHRLRTLEFPIRGYWNLTSTKGKKNRRLIEVQTGILSWYGYTYDDNVIPPDQVVDDRRRNINRALTTRNESGPPIYELLGISPRGIAFQMARPVILSLLEGETEHIGATIYRSDIMKFRRPLSRNLAATKLVLRITRQHSLKWRIRLDNLTKQAGLTNKNQATRNREAALKSLQLLESLRIIRGFNHDLKTDIVTIAKSEDWHFPSKNKGDEDEDSHLIEG